MHSTLLTSVLAALMLSAPLSAGQPVYQFSIVAQTGTTVGGYTMGDFGSATLNDSGKVVYWGRNVSANPRWAGLFTQAGPIVTSNSAPYVPQVGFVTSSGQVYFEGRSTSSGNPYGVFKSPADGSGAASLYFLNTFIPGTIPCPLCVGSNPSTTFGGVADDGSVLLIQDANNSSNHALYLGTQNGMLIDANQLPHHSQNGATMLTGLSGHAISGSGQIAFIYASDVLGGNGNIPTIYYLGTTKVGIPGVGTVIGPGSTVGGNTLTGIVATNNNNSVVIGINNQGQVAFGAYYGTNGKGIFTQDGLVLPLPALSDVSAIAINDNGLVAYFDGAAGAWATQYGTVVKNGDIILGKQIQSLGGNTSNFLNNQNNFVFPVAFTDGTYAMVLATAVNPTTTFTPASASSPAAGSSGTVSLVVTPSNASWTASSNQSWLKVTSPSSGTGNATVSYSVDANSSTQPRTGAVTVGTATFTVTQAGASAAYPISISTNSTNENLHAHTGLQTVGFTLNFPCLAIGTGVSQMCDEGYLGVMYGYGTGTEPWLSFPSQGIGGQLGWRFHPTLTYYSLQIDTDQLPAGTTSWTTQLHYTPSPPSGYPTMVQSADWMVTLQFVLAAAPPTSYTFNPASASIAAAGSSGTVSLVVTPSTASWTASSSQGWLKITSASSGTGNATMSYSVDGNNTTQVRTGTVTVGTAVFTVTQTGGQGSGPQGTKLVGSGATGGGANQGNSVALSADGNTAIVGGPWDNDDTGAAWVFIHSGGAWSQQGSKLVGTGGVNNTYGTGQGYSVALSADGTTAIVGNPGDNNGKGAVWAFTRLGDAWSQQSSKLVGTGAIDNFAGISGIGTGQGSAVALSADGNTAIVGGPGDNNQTGAVWVFTRSGGVWTQQGAKQVGTGVSPTNFRQGSSVALSADGNTAIVGGPSDDTNKGAVWVFTRSGGVWTQQGAKQVGTGATGAAGQGTSVALSADGNTAIVGGENDNNEMGAVWVFTRSGGVWTQQGSKLVGTGGVVDGFVRQGSSVALSADGNTGIVGGVADNDWVGAAWLFTRSGSVWTQQGGKLVGNGVVGLRAEQGSSVALSSDGSTAIVGGPSDNGGIGAAWVFATGLQSRLPDLVVTAFTAPTTGVTGGQISVNVTTTNQGTAAAGPFATAYYLSKSPAVTTNDINTSWYCGSNGLAVSASSSCGGDITLPSSLAPGVYYMAAIADNGNQVAESNKSNNMRVSGAGPITLTAPAGSNTPNIADVLNGASFQAGVASGTWIAIKGSNLAPKTPNGRTWTSSDFNGNSLPTALDGVSVTVNGKKAYICYISPSQINALAPGDSTVGNVPVQVTTSNGQSNAVSVAKQLVAPEIFTYSNSHYGIATVASGFIGPAGFLKPSTRPAAPGEIITLWVNGLGATTPPYPEGQFVSQPAPLASAIQVTIGGATATVQYAGISGTGVYQINLYVPNLPSSDASVVMTMNGIQSASQVYIPIANPAGGASNVALHKPAFESDSTTDPSGWLRSASRAVDGNRDGTMDNGSVTHNGTANPNAYWYVDLQGTYQISALRIWGRTDCCLERNVGAIVSVFAAGQNPATSTTPLWTGTIGSIPTPSGPTQMIGSFSLGAVGQYVKVQLAPGSEGWLSLAEVEVDGVPAGGK